MAISRSMMEKVGLLDEGYEFYLEDIEWCRRVQQAGWQVAYVAEAKITHYGDQSLSKVKERAKQSEYRSALRYFRQYHGLSLRGARVLWIVTVLCFLFRLISFRLNGLVSRRPNYVEEYGNLLRWILHQCPQRVDNWGVASASDCRID